MASNYTALGVQLMTTGEKAGTWGTLTNTNWNIMEQISGGYIVQTLNTDGTGANTTTLSVNNGTAGATLAHRVIILGAVSAQAITGNKIVTIPLDVQTFYIIKNSTSGAYTVQLKYVTGSGNSVTWSSTEKGYKLLYAAADDSTDPNIIDVGFGAMTSFTLAGTSGSSQTISDGNTATIAAGNGITTTAAATDTVTIAANPAMTPYISSTGKTLVMGF